MKATKAGIWMDHQHAFLTEFTADTMKSVNILNDALAKSEDDTFKGENRKHTKEQQSQSDYYKKLSEAIKGYDTVILFGPTTAKEELLNKLVSDSNFSHVRIHTKNAGKMTENQRHAFVREYFTK